MTDTRQVLEEAWEHLCQTSLSFRRYACTTIPGGDGWTMTGKFCRFLDAEAWTDAALMLVPENHRIVTLTEHVDRGGWYVKLAVHSPHKALPAVEADTLALAIAQAALRAKEAGDV